MEESPKKPLPEYIGNAWDQQLGETDSHYAKFLCFRDLGIKRTLAEAYNSMTGKNGKEAPSSWNILCSGNHWVSRSKTWDLEVVKENSSKKSNDREEIRKLHDSIFRKAAKMIDESLDSGNLDALRKHAPVLRELIGRTKSGDFIVAANKTLFGERVIVEEPVHLEFD